MQVEKTTKPTPQKKYICGFCAKAFTRSEHKQRHERSHTNEKPFHCLQCTSSFVRRDLLQRHCRTVHQSQDAVKRKSQDPITMPALSQAPPSSEQQIPLQPTISHSRDLSNESDLASLPQQSQLQSDSFHVSPPLDSTSTSLRKNSIPFAFDPQDHLPLTTMTPSTSIGSEHSPSKRRKKSEAGSGSGSVGNGVLSMRRNSSLPVSTGSNDTNLINLLSISKKLDYILKASNLGINESVCDSFLIGFTTLQELSTKFPIFDTILKELMYYLSTFFIPSSNGSSQVPIVPPPMTPSLSQQNHFKMGIIYSVISLGYIINKNSIKSLVFFKKAWVLLIKKLIPQYNNSNVSLDQIEIASNLFLLSFIYVSYDMENYDINNDQVNQVNDQDENDEQIYLNNTVILEYLDQISFIIISNLADFSNPNDKLIDGNMPLFWSIYIILSFYFNDRSPKIYSSFLNKSIGQEDLLTTMQKFSKSYSVLNEGDEFLKMIIVATIGNELKSYRTPTPSPSASESPDSSSSGGGGVTTKIYGSKNVLHNSVILINRSINVFQPLSDSTSKSKLFELFRKNLIINSPLKYRELLSNYIFLPQTYCHWQLLHLTLDEATINYDLNETLYKAIDDPSQLNSLEYKLKLFLDYKKINLDVNNNISIVSLPMIFFANYLNLGIIDCKLSFNQLQLKIIKLFLIHWYMVMNKLLIMIWCDDILQFEENYILQTFVYMLLDNKSVLLKKLNIEAPHNNAGYEQAGRADAASEFKFNKKWFWILKIKLDNVFEQWMHHIKIPFWDNNFAVVKIQITKCINEHIALEGLMFKEDDDGTVTSSSGGGGGGQFVFNNSGPNLTTATTGQSGSSLSASMLSSTSMNFAIPMQQQVSSNFINYGTMNDFVGGSGSVTVNKRSNSVSSVMSSNFGKEVSQMQPVQEFSQLQSQLQSNQQPQQLPTGGQQPILLQSQHSQNPQPQRRGKQGQGQQKNQSQQHQSQQHQSQSQSQQQGQQQGQQFYSYSTYPPPPPILSSMPKELVLPPISSERRKEKFEVTY
ncbi:hypothetical protein CANMA_001113 [Candida margitis]|uniref:uncharacterized protein n=1 Tax=Candida margitis TaxID=1775924 RepID=UPI0022269886|nr:uncharacterized protein CANMA_001113 [Candida margitis]KAI5969823.1 hypothetical protein CANMA_001113 [Candida margitis]